MPSGLCRRRRGVRKRAMFCHAALEIDLQRNEVSDHAANDYGRRYLSSSRVPLSSGEMCRVLSPLNAIPRACPCTTSLSLDHESAESRRTKECYVTEGVPLAQQRAGLGVFTQRHGLGDETAREKPRQRVLPDVLQEIGRLEYACSLFALLWFEQFHE